MTNPYYLTVEKLAGYIKNKRTSLGISQKHLALSAKTGVRFIIDLEKGKLTCHIGKVITVLRTLGIKVELS